MGRKRKKDPGIYLNRELMKSKAFRQLRATSILVYLAFLTKRRMSYEGRGSTKKWCCTNNGKITFPYSEATEELHICNETFKRAIDQLIQVGLLDIERHGNPFDQLETLYRVYWGESGVDERWKHYGTERFVSKTRPHDPRHRSKGFSTSTKSSAGMVDI